MKKGDFLAMKVKNLFKAIIFLLIFVILFSGVSKAFTAPGDYRNYQWIAGFYEEPKDSLDAVYIGSSNCDAFWNPLVAWEKYGITVYPFNSNTQPIIAAEHLIKEVRKTQPNALIILNTNTLGMKMMTNVRYHYLLDYLPFSLNKLSLTHYLSQEAGVSFEESLEFYFPIIRYAACFRQDGIGVGDAAVVEACQTIEYLAIELALQLIGAIFVPVEHNCAADKISAFAQRVRAKAVIACKAADFPAQLRYTYEDLAAAEAEATPYVPEAFPESGAVSEILFSTGTTGKEKGIVLTHGNDIALAENVMYGVEMEKDNVEMIPSPSGISWPRAWSPTRCRPLSSRSTRFPEATTASS